MDSWKKIFLLIFLLFSGYVQNLPVLAADGYQHKVGQLVNSIS